jgi:hypothetical protein
MRGTAKPGYDSGFVPQPSEGAHPSRLRSELIGGSAACEIENKTSGKAAGRGNDKLDHGY